MKKKFLLLLALAPAAVFCQNLLSEYSLRWGGESLTNRVLIDQRDAEYGFFDIRNDKDPWTSIFLKVPLGGFGPASFKGLFRMFADPLGYSPVSSVYSEEPGLSIDSPLEPSTRVAVLLKASGGETGMFFTGTQAQDPKTLSVKPGQVGGFLNLGTGTWKLSLAALLSPVKRQASDDQWFCDSPLLPGGLERHLGFGLSWESSGFKADSRSGLSLPELMAWGWFSSLRLSLTGRGRLFVLSGGYCSPGYTLAPGISDAGRRAGDLCALGGYGNFEAAGCLEATLWGTWSLGQERTGSPWKLEYSAGLGSLPSAFVWKAAYSGSSGTDGTSSELSGSLCYGQRDWSLETRGSLKGGEGTLITAWSLDAWGKLKVQDLLWLGAGIKVDYDIMKESAEFSPEMALSWEDSNLSWELELKPGSPVSGSGLDCLGVLSSLRLFLSLDVFYSTGILPSGEDKRMLKRRNYEYLSR